MQISQHVAETQVIIARIKPAASFDLRQNNEIADCSIVQIVFTRVINGDGPHRSHRL